MQWFNGLYIVLDAQKYDILLFENITIQLNILNKNI